MSKINPLFLASNQDKRQSEYVPQYHVTEDFPRNGKIAPQNELFIG